MRDWAREAVVAEVKEPEEAEVANVGRHRSSQAKAVEIQANDSSVKAAAGNALPAAECCCVIPGTHRAKGVAGNASLEFKQG